ncbi:MAG: hypothetical protein V2A79_01830 [Planctomycetota bacterium]
MRVFKVSNPFVSVFCCIMLVNNLTLLPTAAANIPDQYTWQVERVEQSSAFAANGFGGGDVALVWEDIPAQFFPLKVTEVWIWWYPPLGHTPHHLAARVLFYDGATGQLRYVLEHAALIRGLNRIRRAIECTECELISITGTLTEDGLTIPLKGTITLLDIGPTGKDVTVVDFHGAKRTSHEEVIQHIKAQLTEDALPVGTVIEDYRADPTSARPVRTKVGEE